MREIVFDTETTGLDPFAGDRLVEIGCIELVNGFLTGQEFHRYVNPQRDMPDAAFQVHGLSADFLRDKPLFSDICEDLLAFIGDAPLIAHNAMFDFGFLNAELDRCKRALLARERIVDTLMLARRKHPAGPNKLDDLCARYGIDNSMRTKHGALMDAELLAKVYLELTGRRQATLSLIDDIALPGQAGVAGVAAIQVRPVPLGPRVSEDELAAHRAFVATLGEKAIWKDYLPASAA
jgi:DNA polymerase-3 subunit epsilon